MHTLSERAETESSLFTLDWRTIFGSLIVLTVVGVGGWLVGQSTNEARTGAAVATLQEVQRHQQQRLDQMRPASEMVSKDEFEQFAKNVEQMNTELRLLRSELQQTREALAATRAHAR